jgi:REP element-mobilizing transposase RayT
MARPLRLEIEDGLYHVTSRGLERRRIVRDDRDRTRWVELLDTVAVRRRWRVLAWVLMENHFHVFVRTPDADLSAGMHDLNSGYVTGFNLRHRRVGPLFQGRFKAILVESGKHSWALTRYIHLNPVRAGLVARPESYAWSSCRHYFESRGAPAWLAWEEVLNQHGRTLRAARRAYRDFLDKGVASPPESPLSPVVASTLLGSMGFVARMRARLAERAPDPEIPSERQLRDAVDIERIAAAVCSVFGVDAATLSDRGRWRNEARQVAMYLCRCWTRLSLRAIGERLGGVGYAAVSKAASDVAERLVRDRGLKAKVRRCERELELPKK